MRQIISRHLFTVAFTVAIIFSVRPHQVKESPYKVVVIADSVFIPCRDNVYELIKEADIKHPNIVLKQAILETGHFTSKGCIERNNLFGFYNGKRYLTFESYQECVDFYKTWQDKKYKGGDYYLFLENLPYAEDTTYTQILKKIK